MGPGSSNPVAGIRIARLGTNPAARAGAADKGPAGAGARPGAEEGRGVERSDERDGLEVI